MPDLWLASHSGDAVEGVRPLSRFAQAARDGVHVKRCRWLMTTVVAISVATLVACSGGSTSSQPPPAAGSTPVPTPATASPAPTTTTAAPAANGEIRLGCATACQNAGGYGAAGAQVKLVDVIKVVGGAVRLDPDGYVPVTLTCLIPATCQGVITLDISGFDPDLCGNYHHAGCSDLVVNANSTQIIGVPLSADALAYARANSPVNVFVDAHIGQPASCEDIPQLIATCEQIVAADPRAGDGLERHAVGNLQVSAT
jgi:hypothetical protein